MIELMLLFTINVHMHAYAKESHKRDAKNSRYYVQIIKVLFTLRLFVWRKSDNNHDHSPHNGYVGNY